MRILTAVVTVLLLMTACTGGDPSTDDPPEDVTVVDPPSIDAVPTSIPTPTFTPEEEEDDEDEEQADDAAYPSPAELEELGAAATCELAGPEFCDDANDNVWPDFVEEELGRDPAVGVCGREDCGGASIDEILVDSQDNTLFILDASGSMAGDAGGVTKMDAAKRALVDYVTVTPDFADLGLMVYGHRGDNSDAGKAESCAGIETFAEIGELTVENAEAVVGQFVATGWTPIGASLDAAAPVLQAAAEADAADGLEGTTNRIILISDGIETCEGDPVASAQALVDLGIQVVVDVIGFDLAETDRAALQQVAETTGGIYRDAANADALRDALGEYVAERRAVHDVINCVIHSEADDESCQIQFALDASSVLFELSDELRDSDDQADQDRGQFISRWTSQVENEYHRQFDEQTTANDEILAELQAEIDRAVERSDQLEGRFEKVATTGRYTCPHVQRGQPA